MRLNLFISAAVIALAAGLGTASADGGYATRVGDTSAPIGPNLQSVDSDILAGIAAIPLSTSQMQNLRGGFKIDIFQQGLVTTQSPPHTDPWVPAVIDTNTSSRISSVRTILTVNP